MKLFECSNGQLINPLLVASCTVLSSENQYSVGFKYPGGAFDTVHCKNIDSANDEKEAFKKHFETELGI